MCSWSETHDRLRAAISCGIEEELSGGLTTHDRLYGLRSASASEQVAAGDSMLTAVQQAAIIWDEVLGQASGNSRQALGCDQLSPRTDSADGGLTDHSRVCRLRLASASKQSAAGYSPLTADYTGCDQLTEFGELAGTHARLTAAVSSKESQQLGVLATHRRPQRAAIS